MKHSSPPTGVQLEIVSWKAILDSRPVPNEAMKLKSTGEGYIVATVPMQPVRRPFPFSLFLQPRGHRRFALDHLGSEIFRLCDGRRRYGEVVDEFARHHRLTFHEARVSVAGYLGHLVHRGVLVIVG